MTTAVVSSMRNEGMFVLEWLAFHAALGCDRAVVCTNDCTDGSDALLDHLAARGYVDHIDNPTPTGEAPQDHGMRRALAHLADTNVEWVLHVDSDEFLNIRAGDGTLNTLPALHTDADCIALPWQFFGNAGHKNWPDEPRNSVLHNFQQAQAAPDPETVNFKSLFRRASFKHAHDHAPQKPTIPNPKVVNVAGEPLQNRAVTSDKKFRKFEPLNLSLRPDIATLNHYATKSDDVFLLKNHRGDGQGNTHKRHHLHWKWHRTANQNATRDTSILRHWPAMEARLNDMRADPQTARLERNCIDWFHTAKRTILTQENRARWTHRKEITP